MQETLGTLGAQISDAPVETTVTDEVKEEVVDTSTKDALVADPNYNGGGDDPAPVSDSGDTSEDSGRTLKDLIEETQTQQEEESRKAELEEKVNKELGVEDKNNGANDIANEINNEVKDATKDVVEEVKEEMANEDPIVLDDKKSELPKEAKEILDNIKNLYDKQLIELRVENKVIKTENEILTEKIQEATKKIAALESSGAGVSNKAIYFDKLLQDGDKSKTVDYLVDLLGVYYPNISKEKLNALVGHKSNFNADVKADTAVMPVITKKTKLEQLRSAYGPKYRI